jgi:hypothetical protein
MVKSFLHAHKEILMLGFSQLLFGMLGALIIQIIFSFMPFKVPMIATVNITGLEDSFIKETSKQALSPNEMKQKVTVFAKSLNQNVTELAKEKHLVLLPREAVIAGSHDLTPEVANRIKQGLSP